MKMAKNESFFSRLTRLFRSGPSIQRRVKGYDYSSYYDTKVVQGNYGYRAGAPFGFGRENSPFSVLGSYGVLDRMSRYAEFSEMEYCLIGDTRIAVPGGYKTIKELADEYGLDKEFIVYSYDHSKKQIVPAIGKQARLTRYDHAYRVTLDSGKEIIGTANHRLLKRDGTYCEIGDLKPNDALMPFYRKDLFSDNKLDEGDGYRWIYTMDKNNPTMNNGWVSEHRLIASWVAGRDLRQGEVVHHINFKKYDNTPDNLAIMTESEHAAFHARINNEKKWNEANQVWIEQFKKRHSEWMSKNNPAERTDVTFDRILNWCLANSFNLYKVGKAFDTSSNVIKRKLRAKGFDCFITFAQAYQPGWKSESWNNVGDKNPRFKSNITFDRICSAYEKGIAQKTLAERLQCSITPITNRLKAEGFSSWTDFVENYQNHKVVSVEYYGYIPLYDLTVDGYKNFATDSVISHNTPEIAAALDIYADEVVGGDDRGKCFHVYSDNTNIKRALDELFYDVLNVEYNLRPWTRNLIKHGDFFLYNEVLPEIGVINAQPIPVSEMEREEGYDDKDPYAVRFKWLTRGNVHLENWQVTHMRILGNDMFLPYGTSTLEPARRIWRQLCMMEDAMLVYRVIRSPERRVFYVDVANVAPNDIPSYMEAVKSTLRSHSVIEKNSGRMDMRYNPLAIDDDYYIPVRGTQTGTKIETLAGGQHVTATEDVQYIQSKLFSALKVPKPYLNFDENLSSKATLAQSDIRFSRTIGGIQKIIIAEMNKLAMIHLYAKGFDGESLINFELKLSNPSSVAIQQKLELWASKAEVAGRLKETKLVDERWIQKNVLELTSDDIQVINKGLYEDKIKEAQLEAVVFETELEKNTTTDTFDPANYNMSGENIPKVPAKNNQTVREPISLPISNVKGKYKFDFDKTQTPIKATPFLTRSKRNSKRRVGSGGRNNLGNPDFTDMLNPSTNKSLKNVFDVDSLASEYRKEGTERTVSNTTSEKEVILYSEPVLPNEMKSVLRRLESHFGKIGPRKKLLTEDVDLSDLDNNEEIVIEFISNNKNENKTNKSLKEAFDVDTNIIITDDGDVEIELE